MISNGLHAIKIKCIVHLVLEQGCINLPSQGIVQSKEILLSEYYCISFLWLSQITNYYHQVVVLKPQKSKLSKFSRPYVLNQEVGRTMLASQAPEDDLFLNSPSIQRMLAFLGLWSYLPVLYSHHLLCW